MPTLPQVETDEADAAVVAADPPSDPDWRYAVLGQSTAQAMTSVKPRRAIAVQMRLPLLSATAQRARSLGLTRSEYLRMLALRDCQAAGMALTDEDGQP